MSENLRVIAVEDALRDGRMELIMDSDEGKVMAFLKVEEDV